MLKQLQLTIIIYHVLVIEVFVCPASVKKPFRHPKAEEPTSIYIGTFQSDGDL